MNRRALCKALLCSPLMAGMGISLTNTVSATTREAYFAGMQRALRAAGLHRPTLVVDLQALRDNIATVRATTPDAFNLRVVTKSLPSFALVEQALSGLETRRLMVFHQPFMNRCAQRWPDCEMLLGKPMPVGAAETFYRELASARFDAAAQVQWLVDSVERLQQYAAFADSNALSLQINLEIDVGFHRGGFASPDALVPALEIISNSPQLSCSGLMGYDGHVSIFPQYVGEPDASLRATLDRYAEFERAAARVLGAEWNPQLATLNSSGSTTYRLYTSPKAQAPVNDIALGSGFLKPGFCDRTLDTHSNAVYIATPVLKKSAGVRVPGIEHDPTGGARDDVARRTTFFLYGGKWMATPHFPGALDPHPVYGRSSNQDMFTSPDPRLPLDVDDFVFFRPTQTEAVLLQFGDLAVYENGSIVDSWHTFASV
jgi:D-serine deaminase-like pyridoxal phosphate-dependent protein